MRVTSGSWLAIAAIAAGAATVGLCAIPGGGAVAGQADTAGTRQPADLDQTPVLLSFDRTELAKVLDAIGKSTGFEIELHGIDGKKIISLETEKRPLREVLDEMGKVHGFEYEIKDGKTLVFRAANSAPASAE